MFFFLSKTLDLAFTPLAWALTLLAASLWLWNRAPRRARALVLLSGLTLYGFSTGLVANELEAGLEKEPSTYREDASYDALVLLGGMVHAASKVEGPRFYGDNVERLHAAFELLRQGRAKVVFATGGHPDAQRPEAKEARVLAAQLVDWGIEPARIFIDDEARNTHENAVNAAKAARQHGWKKLLLVTSAFHMQRALGCFRAQGLEVDTLSVDRRAVEGMGGLAPRAEHLAQSTHALREWAGRWVYRARGYSKP